MSSMTPRQESWLQGYSDALVGYTYSRPRHLDPDAYADGYMEGRAFIDAIEQGLLSRDDASVKVHVTGACNGKSQV